MSAVFECWSVRATVEGERGKERKKTSEKQAATCPQGKFLKSIVKTERGKNRSD